MSYYNDVEINGNTKTTSKYTCESTDLEYRIIGDNIKADFNFINNDLPDKLTEMLAEIEAAAAVVDAFYFENGSKVSDISKAYEEIKGDVELMKAGLDTLHSAFMTDIDNVNAELANNFGYWAFNKPKLASKTTETIETTTSN